MLGGHINSIEEVLLKSYAVAGGAGHGVNKGTPREAFIKGFLEQHLSEKLALGNGEVIDCNSLPGEKRNQIDIVAYYRSFPKLHLGGPISAFLVESVVATIEVKSLLTKDGMRQAIGAAHTLKGLDRKRLTHLSMGYVPPSILSYVVAYDAPSMETVHSWLAPLHAELGFEYPEMKGPQKAWCKQPAPSVDGVFVLGKGFVIYNNVPFTLLPMGDYGPTARWTHCDLGIGSLAMLFLMLTGATTGALSQTVDLSPYSARFRFGPSTQLGA